MEMSSEMKEFFGNTGAELVKQLKETIKEVSEKSEERKHQKVTPCTSTECPRLIVSTAKLKATEEMSEALCRHLEEALLKTKSCSNKLEEKNKQLQEQLVLKTEQSSKIEAENTRLRNEFKSILSTITERVEPDTTNKEFHKIISEIVKICEINLSQR